MQSFKLLKYRNCNFVSTVWPRNFHLTSLNSLVSKEFEEAKSKLSTLNEDPGSDVKLKIYALFKQATIGKCNTSKPSMVDFVNRAKWNAWNDLSNLSQAEAEKQYISIVNDLAMKEAPASPPTNASSNSSKFESIIVTTECENICKITLNRPAKFNALTVQTYRELIQALKEADSNPNILAVCLTGAGKYYCSGNDLSIFTTKEAMTNIKKAAVDGGLLLEEFVNAFITFSKPLISAINGPAVGISVTLLGLFDLIIATDKASFYAPFTKIAQSPEACSSHTFPLLMGNIKAAEILMFNRKLTAQEAFERNLVTEVVPDELFEKRVLERLTEVSKLPKESLLESKRCMRETDRELLKKVNKREVDILVGRWSSQEFVRVIMDFWKNKSK